MYIYACVYTYTVYTYTYMHTYIHFGVQVAQWFKSESRGSSYHAVAEGPVLSLMFLCLTSTSFSLPYSCHTC